ncbi:MAG: DUF4394 domain-containing protein [Acidobacteriota bacterium]
MNRTFAVALLLFTLPLAAEPLTLLDAGGTILRFIDTIAPSFAYRSVTITGLQPNETIGAIDYRPSNGLLYGIGVLASGPARLYTLNTTTGVATQVGSGTFHSFIGASPIGMDFNPVVDRIRLISNVGINLRVNPNDATAIVDTPVDFAAGDVNQTNQNSPLSLAYSNNTATSTTLYGIVSGNGPFLVTVGSPGTRDGAQCVTSPAPRAAAPDWPRRDMKSTARSRRSPRRPGCWPPPSTSRSTSG